MGAKKLQSGDGRTTNPWELARRQHGVVSRAQLLELGFSSKAIRHRLASGRLHRLHRGVYAVGRSAVPSRGRWMAAVLCCGPGALLSHRCAALLWGVYRGRAGLEVVVPSVRAPRPEGIVVNRRGLRAEAGRVVDGIPVTDPVETLVDLASCVSKRELERAVNEADRLDLVDPERLAEEVARLPARRPGRAKLRRLLDRGAITDTGLELRFLAIARAAGLPLPETQVWVNGFRVDFHWPDLGLVVETDGLRYHRTPAQQAADRRRDQAHTASGLTPLRIAEDQIRLEPDAVRRTLATVAARLRTDH